MSSKSSNNKRLSVFGLRLPSFHFEKEQENERRYIDTTLVEPQQQPNDVLHEKARNEQKSSVPLLLGTGRLPPPPPPPPAAATPLSETTGNGRSGSGHTSCIGHCDNHYHNQVQHEPESRKAPLGLQNTTHSTSSRPQSLPTSSRADPSLAKQRPQSAINRKPVPTTYIPYTPPNRTSTAPVTYNNTTITLISNLNTIIESSHSTRTSEESRPPSFRSDSTSNAQFSVSSASSISSVSPSPAEPPAELPAELGSPFQPKKLQKASTMPVAKPPPVPTMQTQYASPALVPTVMATDATPTSERRQRPRSLSPEGPRTAAKLQPNRLQPRQASPAPKGRSVSAQPPLTRVQQNDALRAVSNPHPIVTRPDSVASSEGSPTSSSGKKVRKSWLPGARSRSNSADMGKPKGTGAWIMSPDHQVDYNVAPLFSGEKVPELWNEMGNVLVYLHPKESGLGPSFKVSDYIFSSSLVLNELLLQDMMASASMGSHFLGIDDAERQRPPPSRNSNGAPDGHLYLPPGNVAGSPAEDLNRLVAARNLFAFLTNQPLVGTEANPTLFAAILQISSLLRHFNFTNHDGSSFGDSVEASFDMLLDQFHIHDVRHSREKTIEALILGEQMKSWNLYNEAFAHAVGKYESLIELKSPLYERVSIDTRERLERAHFALGNRLATASLRLESFEFPSLFAGTANSTSNEDYRQVRFKEWRNSFLKMRHFVLGYYKDLFGSWPPKAKSKKNNFSQGGLNRQCLKILYSDLCALYDLLVDRQSLTPRVIDQETPEEKDDKEKMDLVTACISALRRMLSEFEQSTPPVLPPIPYDTPKVPSMTSIHENYNELPPKKQAKFDKLQSHELQLLLIKSRNIDTDALTMPFLLAFKEFELKEAKGAHPHGLIDQRMGYWLFLYVVLQSLPMLVVDAPGLHFTEGVEYFLCEAPQGNPPWAEDAGEVRKVWYQTADRNVVELSADVVMFSVEGIYMRSHCWLAAKEWQVAGLGGVVGGLPPPAITSDLDSFASPLHPPQAVFQDMDPVNAHQRRGSGSGSVPDSPHVRPRSGSPGHRARHAYRASIAMGLEPLPLQGGPMPGSDRSSMVPSRHGSGSSSPVGTPSGLGAGEMYQQGQGQGLRQSRSAVNLGQQHAAGERKLSYGGGPNVPNNYGGEPPLPLAHPPTMPAAMPAHGHAREGSNGGSTFDDILKGMDKGKKPKKKLFGL